jgi:hypothetical protein
MTEGPFLGLAGTFIHSSAGRAVISVILRNREIRIEIESGWIVEASGRRPPVSSIPTSPQIRGIKR